ncbi:glycine N-methyltransferase isoform X1 [Dendrobates tinctorius]|uniref:glycine N-methyltransferase isoform X1 n=1 Tax=Dendrobates tinctorius TaxID=92724 RepID=UPI003CC9E209
MEKDGNLDTFMQAFEKACKQYQLPTEQWARYLTPGLKGKPLEAFASLPSEQDDDDNAIKQALIVKYRLTPEVYRKKFRNLQHGPYDSYTDVVQGLGTHFDQWIHGLSVDTFDLLKDLMIKDQFLHLCPAEVRQFILDREPTNADKAAQVADNYEANRRLGSQSRPAGEGVSLQPTPAPLPAIPPDVPFANARPTSDPRRCFSCSRNGHLTSICPERQKNPPPPPAKASGPNASGLLVGGVVGRIDDNVQHVRVGARLATGLKDTGAKGTLIRPGLAAPEEFEGKPLTVTGIGGPCCPLPMARVFLDWGAGSGVREVGVSENLPTDVLLGTDLGRMVAYYVPDTPPQSDNKGNVNHDDGKLNVLPANSLMSNDATNNHSSPGMMLMMM